VIVGKGVRLAYGFAIGMLVLSALGFRAGVAALDLYLKKEPVPLRRALSTVPPQLGRWKQVGPDGVFSAEIVESLGTTQYLDRNYAIDGDPSKGALALHVAYYTGMIDAVPHVPERCWGAAGMVMAEQPRELSLDIDVESWKCSEGPAAASGERYPATLVSDPVTRRPETVHMPLGEYDASVTEFQDRRDPTRRQVGGYFFVANGRTTLCVCRPHLRIRSWQPLRVLLQGAGVGAVSAGHVSEGLVRACRRPPEPRHASHHEMPARLARVGVCAGLVTRSIV